MKRLYSYLLLLSLLFTACQKEHEIIENELTPATQEEKFYDLKYGADVRHTMNVLLPAGRTEKTPFAILIHGGSWVAGNKEDFKDLQEYLLKNKIASASINYRYISETVNGNDLMDDVRNAVQFIQQNATAWHIRKSGYVMGGASAGAHMSLLYGYKFDKGNTIRCLISASGPVDFNKTYLTAAVILGQKKLIKNFSGVDYKPLDDVPEEISAFCPINYIVNIPTLIIHGTNDILVPYEQAKRFNNKLEKLNVPHKLETIEGEGHDLGIQKPKNQQKLFLLMKEWVYEYGK